MNWFDIILLVAFGTVLWTSAAFWLLNTPTVLNWVCKNDIRMLLAIVLSGPVMWLAVAITYLRQTRGMFR